MSQGHNPWLTQDFVEISEYPACDEIFIDFQPLITPLMVSGHPTADVILAWFNVGFLSLTYLTFQANAYPIENIFSRLESKRFQVLLKNFNGYLVANIGDSLIKDDNWMSKYQLLQILRMFE